MTISGGVFVKTEKQTIVQAREISSVVFHYKDASTLKKSMSEYGADFRDNSLFLFVPIIPLCTLVINVICICKR